MKKLMIAAAIVCAAAMSQAACIKWTANNLYQPGSSSLKGSGYIGYFIDSATYSLSSAQTALGKGDLATVLSKVSTGSDVAFNASGVVSTQAKDFGNYGNDQTVTGYLLIINADDPADATYAYLSAETSATTGKEGQTGAAGFGKLNGANTAAPFNPDSRVLGNWYAVPEPTSGLLLLLGVAGLALKRRRA